MRWLRRSEQTPLIGAPAARREKNYSSLSGHVYQYFYSGHRRSERDREPGEEYVFTLKMADGKFLAVPVFVSEDAMNAWEGEHNRALNSTERYAVAKMALFQAFDERNSPSEMAETIRVRAADLALILETLGLD